MEALFNNGINQLLKNIERHGQFQLQVYEALKIIVKVHDCEYGYISQLKTRKSLITDSNPDGNMFKQVALYGIDMNENKSDSMDLSVLKKYNKSVSYQKIIIANDYQNTKPAQCKLGFKNFALIPVEYKGNYLGQIGLADCNNSNGFNLDQIEYFQAFYSIVGSVLMTEKIESERVQLLEEKEITKAKNMFMANVSHEIRTPLNSIMGSIDYLSDVKLNRTSKEALEDMKSSSFNLLYLVNDILDISGLESDKMDIHLSSERVEAITQAAYLITKSNKSDEIKFSEHIDPKIPKCIITDPQRVKQILINLLSNAFKFTESGFVKIKVSEPTDQDLYDLDLTPLDKISMTPPRNPIKKNNSEPATALDLDSSIATNHYSYRKGAVDPKRRGGKMYIKFSVSDTGIGIKQKNLNKLFKSFSQIDSSTTKRYEGTGLGLAISAGFTKLLQGGISLHSEWKKGSTFFFVIPVQTYTDEESEELDVSILAKKNVLVVDDKVQNIIRLTRILDKYEINYTTCQSPKHAIASYLNNPRHSFDFGMLDVYMPEMNGNELAEYITKTNNSFPLIALSSINVGSIDVSSYFDLILQKPYSEDQLIKAMCSLLQDQSASSSDLVVKRKPKRKKRRVRMKCNPLGHSMASQASEHNIDQIPINDNIGINILIAEDNKQNQKTIKRTLNSLGYYNLTVVDSGKAAIKKIKHNKDKPLLLSHGKYAEKSAYTVILMDIVMPEMDGIAATKRIQKMFKSKKYCPKIFAVTANVMSGDREKCLQYMDGYIEKPINKKELRIILSKFNC